MTDAAAPSAKPAAQPKAKAARPPARAFWLRQLQSWHWISAAVSMIGLLLFAVTGVTLNHAAQIPAEAVVREQTAVLPAPLLARLATFPQETTDPAPDAVARWADAAFDVRIAGKPTETTAEEIYVALPMPGGDAWLTIDRATGEALDRKSVV